MDVWAPKVERVSSTELSLSQIWVIAGSVENGDRNTINEAGWQVYGPWDVW
ncbi:hypothetical protein CASFOL_020922 [Castilleja foliolosa]|uniref:Neprosin PEP catalytic domain-containing protein n=1 Tax=Castilleja foliolosa TaxID=1961234 RepID=A0ABD3D283_9LAMI